MRGWNDLPPAAACWRATVSWLGMCNSFGKQEMPPTAALIAFPFLIYRNYGW